MAQDDLSTLLEQLEHPTTGVERHIWLIRLITWVRGAEDAPDAPVARVTLLLDVLAARPHTTSLLRSWWAELLGTVDGSTLLSDYGFGSRNAFMSELMERLNRKLLPATPETQDASELFALVLNDPRDARWIAALPADALTRLATLLSLSVPPPGPVGALRPVSVWQHTLLNALTFCVSQIRATGFSQEMRLRMSSPVRDGSPFHTLAADLDKVIDTWLGGANTGAAAQHFRTQLDACRQAAATVYSHLDAHGISVDLVFRLRQLRERVLRVRALLDCLLDDTDHTSTARLLSHLASVGQEQRSVGALIASNSSLLAAKVAERSSETGEHYITPQPRGIPGHARQRGWRRGLDGPDHRHEVRHHGAGAVCVLVRVLVGRDVCRQLCADPDAAFHAGHQAARDDGPCHGRQIERHFRLASAAGLCGRGHPPGALADGGHIG